MATIRTGVQWGMTQLGKPYDASWANRFGPNAYDCSGLVSQVLWHAGMPNAALPTNSADMTRWLIAHPQYRLDRNRARGTYGALMLLGGVNGYGGAGHVGISLGDGRTLEARGGKGVGVYGFDDIRWDDFMLAPDVDYNQPPPPPPIPPHLTENDDMMLMRASNAPEVWLVTNTKTHVTAEAYPFWLFFMVGRPGAVDPTTRKEWVVDPKMLAAIPTNTP